MLPLLLLACGASGPTRSMDTGLFDPDTTVGSGLGDYGGDGSDDACSDGQAQVQGTVSWGSGELDPDAIVYASGDEGDAHTFVHDDGSYLLTLAPGRWAAHAVDSACSSTTVTLDLVTCDDVLYDFVIVSCE